MKFKTSIPSFFGILISQITRLYADALILATASTPSTASSIIDFGYSSDKTFFKTLLIASSSSTIKIFDILRIYIGKVKKTYL